ncbi:MAG: hypothetical protein B7Z45_10810 [Azorhizobium sp. 12-66-6]|nr:MAG: hypothetical protein B7Z45_10810 [Azorhizobium sp. 12-66-6]
MTRPILILGGTRDARQLAARLADRDDLSLLLSLAGRTEHPAPQPVPVRSGGFGGAEGLADFLRAHGTCAVIDATHPYAANISSNAALACAATGVPLLALGRPAWAAQAGDYETALYLWEMLARAGIARAQNNIGACFAEGLGVERDPALAFRWLHLAAENGDPVGQRNLAALYFKGEGAPQDYLRAAELYRAAAD